VVGAPLGPGIGAKFEATAAAKALGHAVHGLAHYFRIAMQASESPNIISNYMTRACMLRPVLAFNMRAPG
jgi:hypothetical protein